MLITTHFYIIIHYRGRHVNASRFIMSLKCVYNKNIYFNEQNILLDGAERAKQACTGLCIAKEPFLRDRLGTVGLLVKIACFVLKKHVLSII
jgi:hypothetical protein